MGFIISIVNALVEALAAFGLMAIKLLPTSPLKFEGAIDSKLMGYINYFVPVGTCIQIGVAWLSCISIWYVVQIGLRWVKAID